MILHNGTPVSGRLKGRLRVGLSRPFASVMAFSTLVVEGWREILFQLLTKALKPDAFERLAQRVLRESGFIQVEVTGKSGDGGIDGRGIVRVSGLLSFYVIFQCKRFSGAVGAGAIAKGMEFRAVVVMACDDEIVPLQERIEEVGDEADLKDIYDTERQLLYVACTRARDYLLVTSVVPSSEFIDDMTDSPHA